MTTNHDDHPDDSPLSYKKNLHSGDKDQRREPLVSGFEEDDEAFEEHDRDTDYSSGYSADSLEEEDFDDNLADENDNGLLLPTNTTALQETESDLQEPEPMETQAPHEWLEETGYDEVQENTSRDWPLLLVSVAVIALVLLAFGGYGVMQERSATREETRLLRAELATSASTMDVNANRAAMQALQDTNAELAANAGALAAQNRRLSDTVAGLEAQLKAQQAALTKKVPATKTPDKPAAVPKPATPQTTTTQGTANNNAAAPSSSGNWFVNFGSYTQTDMAETWANRLRPATGRVIIAKTAKDGKTIYRVRVVGLASKDAASKVARSLEAEMGVSSLWVGSD
ncbi:MAG: SPOR domain-containing protein [Halioglobus sp.]|nr:SPOR domain-containing protein [Halioglobus sp.]